MLRLSLFVALVASASAAAQTTPDPTPAYRYYPLAVGNEWQYANVFLLAFYADADLMRRQIVRDTVIAGTRYFVEVTTVRDQNELGWRNPTTRVMRFDSVTTQVMIPDERGGESPISCPWGAEFGSVIRCFRQSDVVVSGGLDVEIPFGRDPVDSRNGPQGRLAVEAIKGFAFPGPFDPSTFSYFVAPVGYAGETPGVCGGCSRHLIYVRVLLPEGVYEVGARYAVATDGAPQPSTLTLTAGPNPSAGPLAVVLDGATGAGTVQAFDALGRRVWQQDVTLGAGRQRVEIDAAAWAPGIYVIRATAGGQTATARVVRR